MEFPSRILVHWLSTPEMLERLALRVKTGNPMPLALVEKMARAKTFNQGFATVEYHSSALVDMKLHLAGEADIAPDPFEKATLSALHLPKEMVMRHRPPTSPISLAAMAIPQGIIVTSGPKTSPKTATRPLWKEKAPTTKPWPRS